MRLTIALILAAVLLPLHRNAYHLDITAIGPAIVMLMEEILIGAVLELTARLTISALEVAGSVIAQQLGLGFVTAIDPAQGEQGMLVGNFLTMLAITLFFATDMHHLVIAALNDSYSLFEPGEVPATGDVAALMTKTVSGAFKIGIQLSAPFLVFGLLFNLGLGVLSRLMPQMQVFFCRAAVVDPYRFSVPAPGARRHDGIVSRLRWRRAARPRTARMRSPHRRAQWPKNATIPSIAKIRRRGGLKKPSSAATSSKGSKSQLGL